RCLSRSRRSLPRRRRRSREGLRRKQAGAEESDREQDFGVAASEGDECLGGVGGAVHRMFAADVEGRAGGNEEEARDGGGEDRAGRNLSAFGVELVWADAALDHGRLHVELHEGGDSSAVAASMKPTACL